MTRLRTLLSVLAATSILGGVALANDRPTGGASASDTVTAAQRAADRDVGKLSKDGAQAFRDLRLARLAIYNADPAQAKDLIGKAQAALAKARTDDAVYMKAESALKSDPASKGSAAKPVTAPPATGAAAPASQATAWLPVDGQLTLGEDFVATPAKASAVADANKSLARGDREAAMGKLKLADVDVNVVLAVVPLTQTASEVDQAADLIGQGKYYEANAVLKTVEDGLRFDVVDAVGLPKAGAQADRAPAPAAPAQPGK